MKKRREIVDFYINNPQYYQSYKIWHENVGNVAKIETECQALIDMYFQGRILDAGSGPGNVSIMTAVSKPHSIIVGIDISPHAGGLLLKSAKEYQLKNIIPITGDLSMLGFKTASFDCILCTSVLEHILDVKKAMQEFARVLKPGGYMLVRFSNDYSFQQRLISALKTPLLQTYEFEKIEPIGDFKIEEKDGKRTGNLDVTRIDFFKFVKFAESIGLMKEFLTTFPGVQHGNLRLLQRILPFYPFKYMGGVLIALFKKVD